MQTRFAPSFVVVCLLLAIGIVVSLVLWATIRPDDPKSPTSTVAGAGPAATTTMPAPPAVAGGSIQVVALASYDPPVDGGNGEENDNIVDDASADGDPATNWMTECYSDQYMGKAGVGVVMSLSAPASGTVNLDVGSAPYVVDVFATAGEQIPAQIDLWGERLDRLVGTSPAPHTVTIPTAARHVLVLFRQAGNAPSCGHPYQAVLGELAFTPAG